MAPQVQDLVGRTFGRLLVIRFAGFSGKVHRKAYWWCRCSCGKLKRIMGQSLRQGLTISCGCALTEWAKKLKVMGPKMKFGRLTTIRKTDRVDSSGRRSYWLCRCTCGKLVQVRGALLVNGHTSSCGCLRRERLLASVTTHGQSYTKEYRSMKARERLALKRLLDIDWTPEMKAALQLLQPTCVVCGIADHLHVDHARPLSKGHGLRPGNAVTLCQWCNSVKHARDLSELPPDMAKTIAAAAKDFEKEWFRRHR